MPRLRPCVLSTLTALTLAFGLCATAGAAVTECDRLAGHADDPDRVVPGVSRADMDRKAAERACREAVAENPGHARSHYQLGRVLYYDGRAEEALEHLRVSAEAGYRQSLFVLGYIQTIEDQVPIDYCAALELWQRSAALDHPWTGIFMVKEYLEGHFDECGVELSDADLERLIALGLDHIPYGRSQGRIEPVLALLEAHREARAAASD
jgi:tetratricopeptide (TPR) repeat protein